MICFPNAKINIGLHITGKRPDGYHSIESIFYPIPLKDALEVVISEKTSFKQTGLPLTNAPEDNLVMKAYTLMSSKFKIPPLNIFLKKAIPPGAGLGGGSADAAFMLKLLHDIHKRHADCFVPRNDEREQHHVDCFVPRNDEGEQPLLKIAESIGADCPFFIHNAPAFVTGTGNIFHPTGLSLKGYYLFIVKPPVSIDTKEAYSIVTPKIPAFSLDKLSSIPVREWKQVLKNDFESSVFEKNPFIGEIKDTLYAMGAEYAAMSGSGSAVFGLFKKHPSTISKFADCFVWKGMLE